jgi:hypothetical protein
MTKSSQPSRNTSSNKLDIVKELSLRAISTREDINDILRGYGVTEIFPEVEEPVIFTQEETETIVIRLFKRFHQVATTLLQRYDDRPTLEIGDEYDVQDLLEALLRIYFDDVRPEEPTESYAGARTFIDFLLKRQNMGIEVKHGDRGNRSVREEINSDKINYQQHTSCTKLLCLVYDPNHRIKNPDGFEEDLSKPVDGMETRVFVIPKPTVR